MEKAHRRQIVRNFSSLIFAQVIYKLISFFIMIIIARFLGPDNFGIFSYGLSFVWLFLFISDFGFTEIFIRDVSRDKYLLKQYVNNIISLKLIIGSLVLLLIFFLSLRFSSDISKFWICLILGLSVIFDSFVYFFRSIFRVREAMEKEAALIVVEAVLKIVAIYFIIKIKIGLQSVILVSLAFLAASTLNLILNTLSFVSLYGVFSLTINKRLSVQLLKNSLPFALIYILSLINFRVDILMLSSKIGDMAAGYFSANYKLLEQFFLIPITLSYVYLPVFSRIAYSGDAMHNMALKTIMILLPVGIVIPVLFYFFGGTIISVIYGEGFIESAKYLYILSFSLLPFFVKPIIEKVFYAVNRQLVIFSVYLCGAALNIFLNCIAIPRWGINGASLSTFLSECIVIIVSFVIYLRYRKTVGLNYDTESQNNLAMNKFTC